MQLPDMPAELAAFMPRLQGLYVRDCYVQLTDLVVGGGFSLFNIFRHLNGVLHDSRHHRTTVPARCSWTVDCLPALSMSE